MKLRGQSSLHIDTKEFFQLLDLLLVRTKLKYLSWITKT